MADDALTRKEAEMEKLLPCPFCGNVDVDPKFSMFQPVEGEPSHEPGCMKCGASAPAEIWNSRQALSLESVREEAALRNDECWEIIRALDAEGKASSLIGYPLTDTNRPTIRAWLQKRIDERNLQHAPARVAEGGLTPEERRIAEIYMSAGNSYPGDQENAGILARACLRLSPSYAPESPAKEQPGGQELEVKFRMGKSGPRYEFDIEGCCCAIHHPNYGRCLQCPIHGTPPPPERA